MSSALLSVRNLRVAYGGMEVVKGIDLEVEAGKITALIGANGAGKTTLLRTISGLIRPTYGQIIFQGQDLVGTPSHIIVRRGLIQVPEGRMTITKMTVRENLLVAAAARPDRRDVTRDIEQLMDRFAILRERDGQRAGTMSGGQQQILVIARALIARPKLLLLDEPSLGLAPLTRQAILALISEIGRDGMTVLLVEQNARRALEISHHAYVIELGRVAVQGASADILHDPNVARAYLGA